MNTICFGLYKTETNSDLLGLYTIKGSERIISAISRFEPINLAQIWLHFFSTPALPLAATDFKSYKNNYILRLCEYARETAKIVSQFVQAKSRDKNPCARGRNKRWREITPILVIFATQLL